MSQGSFGKTRKLGRVLITGGAGFVGQNFVRTLLDSNCKVRSLDRVATPIEHENLEVWEGDIRNPAIIKKAVKGVNTIFHTAAVIDTQGISAATQSQQELSHDINVEATKQLVILARAAGVKRFVYTSSNSVVMAGKPLRDVDESEPYTDRVRDLYTETKLIAEKWVLKQNDIDGMLTCAIRPSSIWGPGDQTMFKRIFEQIIAGNLVAKIGFGFEKLDNTFVHNLIQGQIKAAEHLVPGGTAPGQAYFINDGEPINAFEFSKPVFEAIGVKMPFVTIPGQFIIPALKAWELAHFKLGLPEPPLPPSDVERVTFDNYFSTKKAQREIGYKPEYTCKNGMEMSLPYYKQMFNEMKQQAELALN